MAPVTVNYINDPNFRITDMSWERINFLLTIESDYEEELDICLTRMVFPADEAPKEDDDDENDQETVLTAKLLKEIRLQPYKRDAKKLCIFFLPSDRFL